MTLKQWCDYNKSNIVEQILEKISSDAKGNTHPVQLGKHLTMRSYLINDIVCISYYDTTLTFNQNTSLSFLFMNLWQAGWSVIHSKSCLTEYRSTNVLLVNNLKTVVITLSSLMHIFFCVIHSSSAVSLLSSFMENQISAIASGNCMMGAKRLEAKLPLAISSSCQHIPFTQSTQDTTNIKRRSRTRDSTLVER